MPKIYTANSKQTMPTYKIDNTEQNYKNVHIFLVKNVHTEIQMFTWILSFVYYLNDYHIYENIRMEIHLFE